MHRPVIAWMALSLIMATQGKARTQEVVSPERISFGNLWDKPQDFYSSPGAPIIARELPEPRQSAGALANTASRKPARALPDGALHSGSSAPAHFVNAHGMDNVDFGEKSLSRDKGNGQFTVGEFEPTSPSAGAPEWFWQVLPAGIIYHSYWAGLREPRLGVQLLSERGDGSYWDPTVGARVGIFRYGNDDALRPQGWQLDIEGAAMARLTLDYWRDLETVDFRGGIPLTYGIGNWQFKVGFYHLSSHLGDEYAISKPGSLDERVNYVRDAVALGISWHPVDFVRLYAEAAYAFNATGGAEPWEFQFGTELSRPGVTGPRGTPFLALNGHLREEHRFGGDFTAESGWLWRNRSGQVLRIGAFYFNGKSSQYQFYNDSQQQIGGGVWYDF